MSTAPPLAETTVTCGPLVAGGDSLVRRENEKVLFVDGGIPDERVDVAVTEERKDLARGRVLRVIEPSAHRVEAPCPIFHRGCGGCQWQHIEPTAQQQFKTGIVADALARIAKLPDAHIEFAGAVSPFAYRTTMRLPVVNERASLHKRGSKETVALDTCLIAHPSLHELLVDGRFGTAKEVKLRVGVASGERLAWISGGNDKYDLPDDVAVTRTGRKAVVHEDVLGSRFRLSARSFFQSGPEAAELVTRTVDSVVPDGVSLMLDAYSGVGVLSGVIARRLGARVVAIDQDGASVNDAKENLAGIEARLIMGEVAAVRPGDVELPELIIADPARSGLGPSASRALSALGAATFILVSCDPASLARDVNLLRDNGYDLQQTKVLDLFPQTHHVETVSVFVRR